MKAFPDAQHFDVRIRDNAIRLMPVKIAPVRSSLNSVREKIKKFGLTEKDVGEAIQRARNRKR